MLAHAHRFPDQRALAPEWRVHVPLEAHVEVSVGHARDHAHGQAEEGQSVRAYADASCRCALDQPSARLGMTLATKSPQTTAGEPRTRCKKPHGSPTSCGIALFQTYPSLKRDEDRQRLSSGLLDGDLATVATDELRTPRAIKLRSRHVADATGRHDVDDPVSVLLGDADHRAAARRPRA